VLAQSKACQLSNLQGLALDALDGVLHAVLSHEAPMISDQLHTMLSLCKTMASLAMLECLLGLMQCTHADWPNCTLSVARVAGRPV